MDIKKIVLKRFFIGCMMCFICLVLIVLVRIDFIMKVFSVVEKLVWVVSMIIVR